MNNSSNNTRQDNGLGSYISNLNNIKTTEIAYKRKKPIFSAKAEIATSLLYLLKQAEEKLKNKENVDIAIEQIKEAIEKSRKILNDSELWGKFDEISNSLTGNIDNQKFEDIFKKIKDKYATKLPGLSNINELMASLKRVDNINTDNILNTINDLEKKRSRKMGRRVLYCLLVIALLAAALVAVLIVTGNLSLATSNIEGDTGSIGDEASNNLDLNEAGNTLGDQDSYSHKTVSSDLALSTTETSEISANNLNTSSSIDAKNGGLEPDLYDQDGGNINNPAIPPSSNTGGGVNFKTASLSIERNTTRVNAGGVAAVSGASIGTAAAGIGLATIGTAALIQRSKIPVTTEQKIQEIITKLKNNQTSDKQIVQIKDKLYHLADSFFHRLSGHTAQKAEKYVNKILDRLQNSDNLVLELDILLDESRNHVRVGDNDTPVLPLKPMVNTSLIETVGQVEKEKLQKFKSFVGNLTKEQDLQQFINQNSDWPRYVFLLQSEGNLKQLKQFFTKAKNQKQLNRTLSRYLTKTTNSLNQVYKQKLVSWLFDGKNTDTSLNQSGKIDINNISAPTDKKTTSLDKKKTRKDTNKKKNTKIIKSPWNARFEIGA